MKLDFEIINTYTEGPKINFAHDADGLFTKYYRDGKFVLNESIIPTKGILSGGVITDELDYNNLIFEPEPNRLTAQAISNYGVKDFPQFGSYGWFVLLYSQKSKILVPINKQQSTYMHPSFACVEKDDTIEIAIIDPQGTPYDCYRVMFRQQLFADEYISYEKVFEVPKPPPGSYDVTIIGYRDDGVISVESDIQTLSIA